ncbi:MAG: hypothetical protein AAF363_19115 [Bacteroidota bacterium]
MPYFNRDSQIKDEYLSVLYNDHKVVCECNIFYMRDNHEFTVAFVPSLSLTGYGRHENIAFQMLEEAAEDYFDALLSLSGNELENELSKFGWTKDSSKEIFMIERSLSSNDLLKKYNMPEHASVKTRKLALVA